jgi:hypothetical protein
MSEDDQYKKYDAAVWAAINIDPEQRKQLSSSGVRAKEIREENKAAAAKAKAEQDEEDRVRREAEEEEEEETKEKKTEEKKEDEAKSK